MPAASLFLAIVVFTSNLWGSGWEPPKKVSRDEIIQISKRVLALPDREIRVREDIFRIRALELDWDIGAAVFEPVQADQILAGADGKKVGAFVLHGGSGDHRGKESVARLLAGKFGVKVVTMTYPGRLYLEDPSRDWPGDTMNPDGTVRTPIWKKGEAITADQYEVREDQEESRRARWGTLTLACAKEGTTFYDRMAGWPVAFEEGAKDLMRRHFPVGEYSIYLHGHSTGGPFADMLSQRVSNVAGVIGLESAPFGYISEKKLEETYWDLPFNCLRVRSWRDHARYAGPEILAKEGPEALNQLPRIIEDVLGAWRRSATSPHFKAENIVHFGAIEQVEAAARATAKRLKLDSAKATQDLVERFLGYMRELSGPGTKPVPPMIFGITKTSTDYTIEKYEKIVLPMYARIRPEPKVRVIQFDAGTHGYTRREEDLPMGPFPAVAELWIDAITKGYYLNQ